MNLLNLSEISRQHRGEPVDEVWVANLSGIKRVPMTSATRRRNGFSAVDGKL